MARSIKTDWTIVIVAIALKFFFKLSIFNSPPAEIAIKLKAIEFISSRVSMSLSVIKLKT